MPLYRALEKPHLAYVVISAQDRTNQVMRSGGASGVDGLTSKGREAFLHSCSHEESMTVFTEEWNVC